MTQRFFHVQRTSLTARSRFIYLLAANLFRLTLKIYRKKYSNYLQGKLFSVREVEEWTAPRSNKGGGGKQAVSVSSKETWKGRAGVA